MMTRPAHFRQADVQRALLAAGKAGLNPSGCVIAPDGSIKLEFSDEPARTPGNPLDRILK